MKPFNKPPYGSKSAWRRVPCKAVILVGRVNPNLIIASCLRWKRREVFFLYIEKGVLDFTLKTYGDGSGRYLGHVEAARREQAPKAPLIWTSIKIEDRSTGLVVDEYGNTERLNGKCL